MALINTVFVIGSMNVNRAIDESNCIICLVFSYFYKN